MSYETNKSINNSYISKSCMWDEGPEYRTYDVIASLAGIINRASGHDLCESNYDAHSLLVKAGVVSKRTNHDHESCCCYYYFSSRKSAENFVKRFNDFMEYLGKGKTLTAVATEYKKHKRSA
jgi:hypothetical protein